MTVLVDTTVWSLALRRRSDDLSGREREFVEEWRDLTGDGSVALVGPIRQEILSGIREAAVFDRVRDHLSAFRHLKIMARDYDEAAAMFNRCRRAGIQGTSIDMLICAVSSRLSVPIFTTDADFIGYATHLPIRLHEPR